MKQLRMPVWMKGDQTLLLPVLAVGLVFRWGQFHLLRLWQNQITGVPDDAFYYFSIAKHIALGHGITIDGVHATNGMHPLWLLLISPFFTLFPENHYFEAIHALLGFQLLLDTAIVWLIGDTIRLYAVQADSMNRRSAFVISALIYAMCSPIVNGLETTITSLLLILWLRHARSFAPTQSIKFWLLFGALTGFLVLARTDMVILLVPVATWLVVRYRHDLLWARVAASLGVSFLLVSPWVIWNLIHFGTILQSSAEAVQLFAMRKYDVIYGPVGKYWRLLLEAMRNAPKPFIVTTLGFSALTLGFSIYTTRHKRELGYSVLLLLIAGSILLLVVHSLFRGFIREWYIQQLEPLFLIGFGVSIGMNVGLSKVRVAGRAVLALTLIAGLAFYQRAHPLNYRSQSAMGAVVYHWGKIFESGEKVGAFNSGIYSFLTPRPDRLVNLDGVVNQDVLPYLRHGNLGDYLRRDSIEYIVDFSGTIGGYQGLFDHQLLREYVLSSAVTDEYGDTLVLYRRKHTENRSQENAQR